MNLIEATKYCFLNALKFSGRGGRHEYWNFILFLFIASCILVVINSVVFGPAVETEMRISIDSNGQRTEGIVTTQSYNGGILGTGFFVLTLLPSVSAAVRRLHDIDRSGFYLLTPFAGFATFAVIGMIFSQQTAIDRAFLPAGADDVFISMPSSIPAYLLGGAIALGGIIVTLIWLARASQANDNRFGPNPNEASS
ncbi:DUF805 domain-containing protein [Octadecabacter antarcticus]|uniref:DUF805 domain-containing protein n=1 Tax=Octadecabacter antarcticus TaxID=1217908 RepID=UPI0001806A1C|nr:DUF805 domain-containing protein [Octadecabacter antarcticus]